MASARNPQFDRVIARQVFGWSSAPGPEAPSFSASPAAAIAGVLRTAVPDQEPVARRVPSTGIELSAIGNRWTLEGQLTCEPASDDEDEWRLPMSWWWSESPEALAPVLRAAASGSSAKPLDVFSPPSFRLLCYGLGSVNSLLRAYRSLCGFRLEWPVESPEEFSSMRWRSTTELIPGCVRRVGSSGSPALAVTQLQRRLVRALTSGVQDGPVGSAERSRGVGTRLLPGMDALFGTRQASEAGFAPVLSEHSAADASSTSSPQAPVLAAPVAPPAKQLRQWREDRSLTQEEAGLLVGISRRGWQSWELGANPIPQWMGLALDALEGRLSSES